MNSPGISLTSAKPCRHDDPLFVWRRDQPSNANYCDLGLHRTSEVGYYPSNHWGMHDMHGNVSEWVEDDWHETYQGAPSDVSAWTGR
jgi:formylglycine-generating enzyme required for sulfatase activity